MRAVAPIALLAVLSAALTCAAAESFPTGSLVEKVSCQADPTQTYTLYLPSSYDTAKRWPVLLVFDPRGRSVRAAERFRGAAEANGWVILSSDNTRSDGSAEPNIRALNAMWPELRRFAVDPRRIYVAGFSGGAHLAWGLARETGAVAGVIASGGRCLTQLLEDATFDHFLTAGTTDFNYREMRQVERLTIRQGQPHRFELFDGPHDWPPEALARQAVEWLELQAMRRGLRPRDEKLVERLLADDLAAALELEASGQELQAMRRYQAIAASYAGLADVEAAAQRTAELEASPAIKDALRLEKRCEGWENSQRNETVQLLVAFQEAETATPVKALLRDLGVTSLQKKAQIDGWEGVTAQRLLNTLLVDTSFYVSRDLLAQKRWGHAAAILAVATAIRPTDPVAWYNLACALARSGRRDEAVEALGKAVANGFSDRKLLAEDPDLEAIRELPAYERLRDSLPPSG